MKTTKPSTASDRATHQPANDPKNRHQPQIEAQTELEVLGDETEPPNTEPTRTTRDDAERQPAAAERHLSTPTAETDPQLEPARSSGEEPLQAAQAEPRQPATSARTVPEEMHPDQLRDPYQAAAEPERRFPIDEVLVKVSLNANAAPVEVETHPAETQATAVQPASTAAMIPAQPNPQHANAPASKQTAPDPGPSAAPAPESARATDPPAGQAAEAPPTPSAQDPAPASRQDAVPAIADPARNAALAAEQQPALLESLDNANALPTEPLVPISAVQEAYGLEPEQVEDTDEPLPQHVQLPPMASSDNGTGEALPPVDESQTEESDQDEFADDFEEEAGIEDEDYLDDDETQIRATAIGKSLLAGDQPINAERVRRDFAAHGEPLDASEPAQTPNQDLSANPNQARSETSAVEPSRQAPERQAIGNPDAQVILNLRAWPDQQEPQPSQPAKQSSQPAPQRDSAVGRPTEAKPQAQNGQAIQPPSSPTAAPQPEQPKVAMAAPSRHALDEWETTKARLRQQYHEQQQQAQQRPSPHAQVRAIMQRLLDAERPAQMAEAGQRSCPGPLEGRTIAEVMTRKVVCALASLPLGQLAREFQQRHLSAIPVLATDTRHYLGLMTLDQVLNLALIEAEATAADQPPLLERPIGNWLNSEGAQTVPGDMPLNEAVQLMLEQGLHHLVIVEDEALKGIFSSFDALKLFDTPQTDTPEAASGRPDTRPAGTPAVKPESLQRAQDESRQPSAKRSSGPHAA